MFQKGDTIVNKKGMIHTIAFVIEDVAYVFYNDCIYGIKCDDGEWSILTEEDFRKRINKGEEK